MSQAETTRSLASAAAAARREEIRQEMDQARTEMAAILSATHNTIKEIGAEMDRGRAEMEAILRATHETIKTLLVTLTPLAKSLAVLTVDARTSLTTLSREAKALTGEARSILSDLTQEAKASLNAVQSTAAHLPTAHAQAVKRAVTELEKRTTELYFRTLQMQEEALKVTNYMREIQTGQRKFHFWTALATGLCASLLPTCAILGLAGAARLGDWGLLWQGFLQVVMGLKS